MTDERIYALYADSQDDLERLIGLRGILTGAEGMGELKSGERPLQAQGSFKLYGRLKADAFGKRRSGESMTEALEFVKAAPNRVLGVIALEQISGSILDVIMHLEEIKRAGSGVAIRDSSRELEFRFSERGEYHGWIWIGKSLESFIEQLDIAYDVSEMFNPNV